MEDFKRRETAGKDEERQALKGATADEEINGSADNVHTTAPENYSYDEYDSYSPWEQFE